MAASIGGQTRNYIARLDPTTGLADSFNPNASSIVHSIAVQADGKILAGGEFISIGGQFGSRATSSPGSIGTTGLADSFDPSAGNVVAVDRGTAGRQDFSRRLFHNRRRTVAPWFRSFD